MKAKEIYTYMSKIFNILPGLFVLAFLFSCSSDLEDWQQPGEETPIEFDFLLPDDGPQTRVKATFAAGDKIYVTAKVACVDNSDPGAPVETTVVKSSILRYDGSKFNPDPSSNRMMWPKDAVSAHFVAYYYPKVGAIEGAAPTAGSPVIIALPDLKEDTDDLLMANQDIVNMNGIVLLRFAHTTTKLRFHGLSPKAKYLELSCDGDYKLNNRITLTYSDTEGYSHEFGNDGNSGITIEKEVGSNDQDNTYTKALFFLDVAADWKGKKFTLTQFGEDRTKVKETQFEDGIKLYNMKKGRAYYVSFYGGTTNSALEEENRWYESASTLTFNSTDEIKAYFAGAGKNGLTCDLDFNNLLLDEAVISFPATRGIILGSGATFNGNHHAIRNVYVTGGLFNSIPAGATVKNLRLENVKVIAEDTDFAGLLAPSNSGTIENVRISGSNSIGTKNVSYVGGLVGENKGTVKTVQISGALAMETYMENNTESAKVFAVGGLVGYNDGGVSNTEINAGSLLKVAGEYTSGDIAIGGMIGYHAKSKTVTGCSTYVRVDATRMTARNSYVGGFCGVNRGTLTKNEAAGEVKGALFTMRSATGGFLGYTTSMTEKTAIAVVNGCGAMGNVSESKGTATTVSKPELYTGGFCGFSEIDLKNTYSVGTLTATEVFSGEQKTGALSGLISADKTIFNSFSTTRKGSADLPFNGEGTCKTQNAHYRGQMLSEQGVVLSATSATVVRLNNAVSSANGYWSWNSSATVYGGVPYLVKQ